MGASVCTRRRGPGGQTPKGSRRLVDSASRLGPGEEERRPHPGIHWRSSGEPSSAGNLTVAEAVSKELPPLDLTDALELTILIARKDPRRRPRVAARWLLRYLEGCDEVTIDEAAMVASCLAALAGDRYRDAALALRAVAERATSRRRTRGVA